MIDEINLTGAALLGVERNKLPHHRFAPFVAMEDRERWHRHFLAVLKHDHKLSCELALQRGDSSRFYAQLDCLRLKKDGGEPVVRIVLTDIAERKQAETELRIAATAFESQAGIVAEKIRAILAEPYMLKLEHEVKTETTVEHHCTSSIGVVLFIDHQASTEEIIKWADMAMYQAKVAGGNLIRFYEAAGE